MTPRRPVALVTGGARRVGRAICLALARAGCDIALTFRTSDAEAHQTLRDLEHLGARASGRPLDLDDLPAIPSFAERLLQSTGAIDVLIHNASIYERTPLESLTADSALRHMRVNALAPLLLTRALADSLARSTLPGGGAVVAMCDVHAMGRPRRAHAPYLMSKAALAEMVRSLALDLAPRVRVNGVAPGVVAFPDQGEESDPEYQHRYLSRVPLGRSGTPEDAAEVVRWLALDATYLTGEIIRVDGGRWLR